MSKFTEQKIVTDTVDGLHSRGSSEKDHAPSSGWDKFKEFLDRVWAYEIFSVIVSLGALGAMVGVLEYMDNKPLTSWTARISPNTVISILSTLCKATIMTVIGACIAQLRWVHYRTAPQKLGDIDTFANATKGTVGSLKMFWGLSKKHTSGRVACFAAFLIGIAIAIDPFSQQVLKYQVDNIATQGLAATMPVTHGIGDSNTILDNNQAWKGLYAGLLGFDYPLPYQCVSGNCTWPPFATLGVCASCQVSQPFTSVGQNSSTLEANMGNLSIALKNGAAPSDALPNATEAYTLVKSVVSSPYPLGFANPTIFEFLIAQLLVDVSSKPDNFTPAWNVTLCSIDWCGRVYQDVQVTKGNLTQPEPTIVNLQPDLASDCYNGTTCQEFIANSSIVNETYRIDFRQDASNIRELLNFNQDVNTFSNNTWDVTNALTVTATLFWNINVTSAFSKACDTFTDFMRTDNAIKINGTTLTTTTYIRIRWAWLALPAAILFCTIVLLILAISINRGTMLWKSSSLPLLLHPLDYHGQNQFGPTDAQPKTMSKQADAMQVKLVNREDGGMAFSVTNRDPTLERAKSGGPLP